MNEQITFSIELILSLINISIVFTKLYNGTFSIYKLLILATLSLPLLIFLLGTNQYLIFSLLVTYLYATIVFKNIKLSTKIYATALLQALAMFTTSFFALFVHCFFENEIIKYYLDLATNLAFLILLIFAKADFFFTKPFEYFKLTKKSFKIYFLFSLYFVSLLSMLITYIPNNAAYNIWYKVLLVFFILVVISISVIYPVFIANNISKNYYKNSNILIKKQIEAQTEYYKKVAKNNAKLHEFKHNHKNQLIALQTYLENNEIDKAKDYINKSKEFFIQLDGFKTGNYILDALLSDKSSIAEEKNIVIKFDGHIANINLDSEDLCIIFGNALDNAIEACSQFKTSSNKEIHITIRSLNNLLNISITNPISDKPIIINNLIKTTKENRKEHGFGLLSIKKTVEKYNGFTTIECSDHIFNLTIDLPIK